MKKSVTIIMSAIICLLMLIPACKSKKQEATFAPWLQEKIEHINDRYSTVTLYEFEGKLYYAVFCEGPKKSFDMNRTTIYDAAGEVYLTLGGLRKRTDKEYHFFENATDKGVIWQSDMARQRNQERENP